MVTPPSRSRAESPEALEEVTMLMSRLEDEMIEFVRLTATSLIFGPPVVPTKAQGPTTTNSVPFTLP